LTEALRNTAGVATFFLGENGTTNTGDAVFLRGYDASSAIFVDGIRDLGSISRDVFNVQQVEVVKGPVGADIGRTAPTGYINLVTKQPSLEDSFTGSLGVGSADYKRASIDLNRALSNARRGLPPEPDRTRQRRRRPRHRQEQPLGHRAFAGLRPQHADAA
jgi:catecholate siderophore receptor